MTSLESLPEVDTLPALDAIGLDLTDPDQLAHYCETVNAIAAGPDFRLITDTDAFRALYAERLAAEGPEPPWQGGVPRLSDFGRFEVARITPPRLEGDHVVAYFEDNVFGIPYVARFPKFGADAGSIDYDPLPVEPDPAPESDHV